MDTTKNNAKEHRLDSFRKFELEKLLESIHNFSDEINDAVFGIYVSPHYKYDIYPAGAASMCASGFIKVVDLNYPEGEIIRVYEGPDQGHTIKVLEYNRSNKELHLYRKGDWEEKLIDLFDRAGVL